MSIATFTLKSASTQAAAPFSLGHAFRKGHVPAGSQLVADIADLQVVAKNAWSDGSLKYAIISGRASLTAATPLTVTLSIGTPAAGTALTTTDLKATGIVAAFDTVTFGAASFATTDWDSPWQTWVSGPKMSSWIYRKQIGTDAHLVAFVEVRLFSGGEVDVLPWIENGYFTVAGPTNKSDTYTFTLGGTQRYTGAIDLKHHTRTPLINGTMLSYWLGTDPGVTPRHDVAYMQTTELVPKYMGLAAAYSNLSATFVPHQQGNFSYGGDAMGSSGYQAPIGLLPTHDVAYLVCNTNHELLYGAVIRNGYGVSRYPIHYRDQATNRVPRFSTNSTLVLASGSGILNIGASTTSTYTPTTTGSYVASWDLAHCPAAGVMAYLITGHWYHLETTQFALTASFFKLNNRNNRANTNNLRFIPDAGSIQTREAAWGFRLLAHALALIPDSDTTLRSEFATLAEGLIDYYHAIYVAQANNPFGLIEPGEAYTAVNGRQMGAVWQQDFFTAAYGYAISMELAIAGASATKLSAFFQWKAKSVVGRLGAQGDFWYINGDPYNMAYGADTAPNYQTGAGPWLADWAATYAATYFTPPSWLGSTEGVLAGEFDSSSWGQSLWGNIQPAISYAVRHGVAGAQEGYDRMVNASNFSALTTTFNTSPVWGVEPYIPESVVMGKTIRCDTASLITGMIVCGDRGLGVLAADIPTGFTQESMLLNDIDPADPEGTEYRVEILTGPSVGTLFVEENGAVTYTPPTTSYEGVATGTQRVWKNGVSQGDTTYSFTNAVTSHTLAGAASSQANAAPAGTVTLATVLTGAGSSQDSMASAGVITQDVVLVGAASSQDNSTSTGVNTQEHILAASPSSSANESLAASLIQLGQLYAGDTEQFNECTSGVLVQVHLLAASASAQDNSTALAGLPGGVQNLIGASASQSNTCSTAALEVENLLISSTTVEDHTSPGAAVSQDQVLAGAAAMQQNTSGAGSMAQVQTLEAAPTSQENGSAAGALTQDSVLGGASSSTENASLAAPVSQVHDVAGAASLQVSISQAGTVSQVHSLVEASTVQGSQSLIGALNGGVQILAAAPASQTNGCITGNVSQVHVMSGAATAGQPSATMAAVTQDQVLNGAASATGSTSPAGAASQVHALAGATNGQANSAAPGYVVITFDLFDSFDVQAGASSSAPIFVTHDLGGLTSRQTNQSLTSAVKGVQLLYGLNLVQVNVSPTLSLAGLVTIYKPPPNQIFKLSPAKSQRTYN